MEIKFIMGKPMQKTKDIIPAASNFDDGNNSIFAKTVRIIIPAAIAFPNKKIKKPAVIKYFKY